METDEVTEAVIGAALAVHRALGPGLLESTYDLCLTEELKQRDLGFERQHMIPVTYGDLVLPSAYRVDFLVEEQVIVEIKSVAAIDPVHLAQVLTYLKLSGCPVGLLINFNVVLLRDGIRRLALGFEDARRPRRLQSR
ncbi:MAG: GxxExxY protein [Gemmatimonadetes bacterium]|nr:GxxExxY protein [Gemmatimonadota bacterium]